MLAIVESEERVGRNSFALCFSLSSLSWIIQFLAFINSFFRATGATKENPSLIFHLLNF